jgi:hypothetical protein
MKRRTQQAPQEYARNGHWITGLAAARAHNSHWIGVIAATDM